MIVCLEKDFDVFWKRIFIIFRKYDLDSNKKDKISWSCLRPGSVLSRGSKSAFRYFVEVQKRTYEEMKKIEP